MSSYHEQRRDIMALADALTAKRQELLVAVNSLNDGIAALVQESERLFPSAISEVGVDGKVTPITFAPATPGPKDIADFVRPGRLCSHCGQPGHDKRNCPNLHLPSAKTQREVKAGLGLATKPRRKMKPLSAEQIEKRRASLVKARAARGKKK